MGLLNTIKAKFKPPVDDSGDEWYPRIKQNKYHTLTLTNEEYAAKMRREGVSEEEIKRQVEQG